MKTKWLLSSSAVVMGLLGLAATFLPEEIATLVKLDASPMALLILQMLGGLYLGFAMLNWFSRASLIGGIYNRPVVLGNLIHYVVVFFALIRQLAEQFHFTFFMLTVVYFVFAVSFIFIMRSNPLHDR